MQRIPKPIRYRMNFRGQASSAPSGFLVISPFLAPLACRWTLIVVLSGISVVSSTKSCSIGAVRIFSHTPAFVQARNRLYTLCHGPYRSGRSRHGIPVFSQYTIQDCVEHYPAAFFRRKLILDPVPLLFAYLMSFHVLYFIISAPLIQYHSFKTGPSTLPSWELEDNRVKFP